ncbi:APC family permease [Legionella maioricensis]|uniref:APC family permease n=1 Tax=Legionella maioricensis TaxID=2896528 RepID=A0A9X2CXK1_9GAMM|nr:APC family permease [Legionella maioricensis]MCL9682660.1 APC family permease [Legionella maioricensis]MCL9687293.1 APC family permease [Legionella maioricensis]
MKNDPPTGLIRALGLSALIIYGVGDILGAGIYAIVGKIAGHAGSLTWLSFAIAMGIVFLTALTYGELGSRFPRSGGVSVYIQEAFDSQWLSILAGLLLLSATILSMSTLSHAFVGYLNTFGFNIPNWLGVSGFLSILLLINLRGIKQSSLANVISTSVEVSGLLIVLVLGFWYLATTHVEVMVTPGERMPRIGDVFQGAALAFFAFTGFEDLANVAEEVKQPEKNIPRAILSSIATAGILYLAVSWVATAIIPPSQLSHSDSPLLDVVSKSYPAMPQYLFSIIAIFAVSNTTLLNYITASRLLYGMSKSNLLPQFLQTIHSKFHTPYIAILLIYPLVLGFSLTGTLAGLASSTSTIVLLVFSLSSIALVKIKWDEGKEKSDAKIFKIPLFVPCFAVVLNLTAITFLPPSALIPAAVFIVIGCIITWVITKVFPSISTQINE